MSPPRPTLDDALQLLDYRARVAALYAVARDPALPPRRRWERFRAARDDLLRTHPSSPLGTAARGAFEGAPWFPFDPAWRLLAEASHDPGEPFAIDLGEDGVLRLERVARLSATHRHGPLTLALYRLLDYGGGLFLPFRDATAGHGTYGGGRYLLDTRKHADLGREGGRLVLDFNFAYHPSCAYDPRWVCPLAPPENRLTLPVRAGERLPEGGWHGPWSQHAPGT